MSFKILLLVSFAINSCHKPGKQDKIFVRPSEDIDRSIAFTHAKVITMESDQVLTDYTVISRGGKIEAIGPTSNINLPDSLFEINANGMYLMPGLADMHTHINYKEDILPYVANGITTVLNMGSPPSILQYRLQTATKQMIGTCIFASGFVDGPGSKGWLVSTPQQAEQAVTDIKTQGWDFIKAYNNIPSDAFTTLLNKAKQEHIAVIGHGVRAPGMESILNSGQVMIAHAEEYLYTYFNNVPDETKIPGAVLITKNAGAYVTPNLCTYETISRQWGNAAGLQQMLQQPEMKYVDPRWKNGSWNQFNFTTRPGNINDRYHFLKLLTKAFQDANVPLLLGTDTPFMIGEANGFAIHDDLKNLVSCGLSPYQALVCGTRNAGEFINRTVTSSQPFGLIKEGYRADFLLLSANPLSDIENIKARVGVMINGRWLSEKKLHDEMEKLAASF